MFKIKLEAMISCIVDHSIFGDVKAYVKVIEFQKRGLPHAHCIFFLTEQSRDKLKNPTNVDEIIKAEIPGDDDPVLRDTVVRHNIHNPCGVINPNAVCLVKVDKPPGINRRVAGRTENGNEITGCLLYTSPSPRDLSTSRMPSSA